MLTPLHKIFLLKFYCIVALAIIHPLKSGCTGIYKAGARASALSNAVISLSDTWSAFHNQAGLARLNSFSAGFFYDSKFNIDKLSTAACSIVLPVRRGAFGISMLQSGRGPYHENRYGVAFARSLSGKWKAGIQLDYISLLFPENLHQKGFATFEGGILFAPVENFSFGAHIFNPVAEGFNLPEGKQEMPVIIRAGCHYTFGSNLLLTLEGEKAGDQSVLVKSGLEFYPAERLAFRFGASGNPLRYSSGIGYTLEKYSADISFGYHENLGITPSLSIQFKL